MLNLFFGHKTKVLIVNGSRKESVQLAGCLPESEFDVVRTESGRSALKAAARENPEIILLDSELPAGNGWETLSQLKKDDKTSSIPVLMCAPMGDAGLPERAYASGAQGCIPKPLKKEVVVSRIAKRLNRAAPSGNGTTRRSYF